MTDRLKLVVSVPDTRPHTAAFELRPSAALIVGSAAGCDLRLLAGTVSRRHARIAMRDGTCTIVDLGSDNGTYVNGTRVRRAPVLLEVGDLVRLGACTLEVVETAGAELTVERPSIPPEAVEATLLADIAASDTASRLVYADWLEQRGDAVRAEFLRLQEELRGPVEDFAEKGARLRELAARIDVQWRRVVARPAIEACEARFSLRCPKEWGSLQPTSRSAIRHCAACDKDVYYSLTVGEARRHAARGRCVALDLEAVRWAWDMEPPYGGNPCVACGVDLGRAEHDKCPACGARIDADIVLGMLA